MTPGPGLLGSAYRAGSRYTYTEFLSGCGVIAGAVGCTGNERRLRRRASTGVMRMQNGIKFLRILVHENAKFH